MRELGIAVTNASIARHYEGILDGLLIDEGDSDGPEIDRIRLAATNTLMTTLDDRIRVARAALDLVGRWS